MEKFPQKELDLLPKGQDQETWQATPKRAGDVVGSAEP